MRREIPIMEVPTLMQYVDGDYRYIPFRHRDTWVESPTAACYIGTNGIYADISPLGDGRFEMRFGKPVNRFETHGVTKVHKSFNSAKAHALLLLEEVS